MNFKSDFEKYTKRIFKDKIPTAWTRYADGERMIIQNIPVGNGTQATDIDKWKFSNNQIFSKDLTDTLNVVDDNYFYAISCKCCDPSGYEYYTQTIKNKNLSYANLWINSNFKDFRNIIENLDEEVVLMVNYEGKHKQYPFNVNKFFAIPDDVCNFYERYKQEFLKSLEKFCDFDNKLVFISAGPLSEIIIHKLWKLNKTNRYIDIGSSIGDIIHGKVIRQYMQENNMYANRTCV